MTTQTGYVGGLELPLGSTPVNTPLKDPLVELFLDYIAWIISNDLNARLPSLSGTSPLAVPVNNRFAFSPFEDRGHYVKRPVPSLYVWWDGKSTTERHSQLIDRRNRELQVLYIFDELPLVTDTIRRVGLFNAIASSIEKGLSRGYHPLYSYGGLPLGCPLADSIKPGQWAFEYMGGQGVQRIGIEEGQPGGRPYPGFAAKIRLHEKVEPLRASAPDGELHDGDFTIIVEGVVVLERVLEAPDGQGAPEV